MEGFSRRAISIIAHIPSGMVTTYGMIAAAAGNASAARQIARLLYTSSEKHHLPWHRVVNAKGKISPRKSMQHIAQKTLLEKEYVLFDKDERIDFSRFLWIP